MSALARALATEQEKIGTEIGVSNWITVDQDMIDRFAEVTHDDQWIHVNPERAAAETPFGGTIAHGFLTLSLASRFVYDVLPEQPGQVVQDAARMPGGEGIQQPLGSLRTLDILFHGPH